MKEAYVSFEVAKILKEKGFNEPCRSYFIDNVDYIDYFYSTEKLTDLDMGVWETLRPTHQMACAWLREEKNIHIDFYYLPIHKKYMWSVVETKDPKGTGSKELYEDAVEVAIKYCLENLI